MVSSNAMSKVFAGLAVSAAVTQGLRMKVVEEQEAQCKPYNGKVETTGFQDMWKDLVKIQQERDNKKNSKDVELILKATGKGSLSEVSIPEKDNGEDPAACLALMKPELESFLKLNLKLNRDATMLMFLDTNEHGIHPNSALAKCLIERSKAPLTKENFPLWEVN